MGVTRQIDFDTTVPGCLNAGQLLGTCLRTERTAAASRLPQEVNPATWRLEPESQLKMLRRFALVLGKVMPVWYAVSTLLLGLQTWLCWHTPGRAILLTADAIWVLISVASIFVLVPLNSRVAEGAADWQRIHRIWDRRQISTGKRTCVTLLSEGRRSGNNPLGRIVGVASLWLRPGGVLQTARNGRYPSEWIVSGLSVS